MTDTPHAQLAAALRRQLQCAEREAMARQRYEDAPSGDRLNHAVMELDIATANTKAACAEVADLIVGMHRTKTVPQ